MWTFALPTLSAIPLTNMLLNKDSLTGISLQAAGLVALIDLSAIQRRTALVGSASLLDVLFLAPGMHTQQEASNVNGGELPMTAAKGNCTRRSQNGGRWPKYELTMLQYPGDTVMSKNAAETC